MKKEQIEKFMKLEYEPKTDGRVFMVTDIHGQYKMLIKALEILQFKNFPDCDGKTDKLISLGDMCDRGNESLNVLSAFRHNPNYFTIAGNHERTMFHGTCKNPFYSNHNKNKLLFGADHEFWLQQGGEWMKNHDYHVVREIAQWTETLPYVAELHIDGKVIGLTHSEVVPNELPNGGSKEEWFGDVNVEWKHTSQAAKEFNEHKSAQWKEAYEYAITFNRTPAKQHIALNVLGVDAALHGHTIQKYQPLQLGNSLYFDNFASGKDIDGKKYSLNILEYAPSEDAIFELFALHQFFYDENNMLCLR